jgi:hypothetical protein
MRRPATAIFLLLASAACRATANDPARSLVDDLAAAAGRRNARDVAARLSESFRSADGATRADVELELQRRFAMYRAIEVDIRNFSEERGADAIRVRFEARVTGTPLALEGLDGMIPRRARFRFDMLLVPEKESWKIRTAEWQPVRED